MTLADALTKTADGGIKLNISGTLPGEAGFTALVNAWTVARGGMTDDHRNRLDAIVVQQAEDLQGLWRGLWVALGVLKPA